MQQHAAGAADLLAVGQVLGGGGLVDGREGAVQEGAVAGEAGSRMPCLWMQGERMEDRQGAEEGAAAGRAGSSKPLWMQMKGWAGREGPCRN